MVGVKISEPTAKNTLVMSQLDIDLERARNERDTLAKELEKVENEAAAEECREKSNSSSHQHRVYL